MSRRSLVARGAQTSGLLAPAIFSAGLPDQVFDIEWLPKTGVELFHSNLDLAAQSLERVDTLQKLPAELLLSSG